MNLNDYSLWTAIVTPLKDNGDLDLESYTLLLKEQEEAKNGVLTLGSTGEALNLTLEERKKVLAHTLEQNLNVPVMVGVGGQDLVATKEWVEYLNNQAIDAILVVTPLYAKPETEGQYLWFKSLMDISQHPVMLYNVPGRTGKALSFDALKRLSNHEKIWALKEASGSIEEFKKYKEAAGEKIRLYSGDDGMLPAFKEHGCVGLVSVASNAWPKATHEYVNQTLKGTLSSQDADLWDACSAALFCVSNPIPVKRLLFEEKRIGTPTLKLPLCHQDLSQAATVLEASTRINDWINKQEEKNK